MEHPVYRIIILKRISPEDVHLYRRRLGTSDFAFGDIYPRHRLIRYGAQSA